MAAERYILGELKQDESDAFEEHYFDCPECSLSVRAAAKIAATVRLGEPHGAALPRSRMNWWAAAAASVFVAALSYYSIVKPNLWTHENAHHQQTESANTPRADVLLLDSPVRGPGERVAVLHDGEALPLTIVVSTDDPHPVYIYEVRDVKGRIRASCRVTRADANDPVRLLIRPGTLANGKYNFVIRGGDREIAAYPFTVEVH